MLGLSLRLGDWYRLRWCIDDLRPRWRTWYSAAGDGRVEFIQSSAVGWNSGSGSGSRQSGSGGDCMGIIEAVSPVDTTGSLPGSLKGSL